MFDQFRKCRLLKAAAAGTLALSLLSGCGARIPKQGKEALESAQALIAQEAISRQAVYDQLKENYSDSAAKYALEQLEEMDWVKEAKEAVDEIAASQDVSLLGIKDELNDRLFTTEEVNRAVRDKTRTMDFSSYAANAANHYFENGPTYTDPKDLRSYLEQKHFTEEEREYGFSHADVIWKEYALRSLADYLSQPHSREESRSQLQDREYIEADIVYALEKQDWKDQTRKAAAAAIEQNPYSENSLKQYLSDRKFDKGHVEEAVKVLQKDWKYEGTRYVRALLKDNAETMSKDTLKEQLKKALFSDEHIDFVLKYYDESAGSIDDDLVIKEKIEKEKQEAQKKKEEEERRRKEEEQKKKQEEERKRQEEAQRQKEEEQRRQEEAARQAAQAAAAAQAAQSSQESAYAAQPQGPSVWIPKSGAKYHSNPNCSNMKNPSQVTLGEAQSWGYTPCKKCYR